MLQLFRLFKKKAISFEDQLKKLSELGFRINEGIEPELLLEEFSQVEYEEEPYQLLMISLGGEIFRDEQFIVVSNDIWHLDTECIEDHGDYKVIIERLMNMTGLDIRNINDFVDIENEEAWVSFQYNEKQINWDLKIDNDWLDSDIFDKFNQLIRNDTNNKIVLSVLGQDCLIAYLTDDRIKEVNKLIKNKFE
ncbi:hypothetical protein [Cohnella endophytica]|uniref:hypothetical protein n=1 Tax=Cohnella endophytica TaxID=2419778 RepID=UPI001F32405A|nr:hypothetical protein [Cohnella endophytica]